MLSMKTCLRSIYRSFVRFIVLPESSKTKKNYAARRKFRQWKTALKADFHSVQFSERAEFCHRFLLKCVQSTISNQFVLHDNTHFKKNSALSLNCTALMEITIYARSVNLFVINWCIYRKEILIIKYKF